jgi:hypothetical protein
VDRNLAQDVAAGEIISLASVFYRHASVRWPSLQGSDSGGRWGPPRAFPVLYLGRPPDSVVVEAYRHLVDGVEGMRGEFVAPRRFVTAEVSVTKILDLRDRPTLLRVGLSLEALQGPHAPCQRVGQVAHQLGLHGIIAPAATALGETLALFERHLPVVEIPVLLDEQVWQHLPADPRQLRIVKDEIG